MERYVVLQASKTLHTIELVLPKNMLPRDPRGSSLLRELSLVVPESPGTPVKSIIRLTLDLEEALDPRQDFGLIDTIGKVGPAA